MGDVDVTIANMANDGSGICELCDLINGMWTCTGPTAISGGCQWGYSDASIVIVVAVYLSAGTYYLDVTVNWSLHCIVPPIFPSRQIIFRDNLGASKPDCLGLDGSVAFDSINGDKCDTSTATCSVTFN